MRMHEEVYPPEKFPPPCRWKERRLRHHLDVFPEGQLLAEIDERVVGSAATHIIEFDLDQPQHRWVEACAEGDLDNHDPAGNTLYGVDICVSPLFRRRGIGSGLYRERFALLKRFRLAQFVAGARIPGYKRYRDRYSIEEYVDRVVEGEIYDPTLSFQLKKGFRAGGILRNYLPDPDSDNCAVLIVKPNPDFDHSMRRVNSITAPFSRTLR